MSASAPSFALPAAVPGFRVTVAGSLQVAGLEILGVRAYDAVSRGFVSPDPVVSPVGAGWGSNVYAFVGNDPVGLVDPWGLSPLTASEFREYRADVRGRAVERAGKGLAGFARDNAGWIALGVAAVGVAAAVVSGPIGWSILAGMAISGGIELGSQLISGDGLDWRKIATSASIGGIAGGLGVVSPRVTPLRQNYVSGSTVENIAGFGLDRIGDYALGVANYVVTPQENSLNIPDAGKEGLKSMLSGGSSGVSSSSADAIRPATPLRNE